jgi:hypothetical protein
MMGGGWMKRVMAVLALAGAFWGCDAKTPSPTVAAPPPPPVVAPAPVAAAPEAPKAAVATYTERVKIDDV